MKGYKAKKEIRVLLEPMEQTERPPIFILLMRIVQTVELDSQYPILLENHISVNTRILHHLIALIRRNIHGVKLKEKLVQLETRVMMVLE